MELIEDLKERLKMTGAGAVLRRVRGSAAGLGRLV